jgi:hypothetical protein
MTPPELLDATTRTQNPVVAGGLVHGRSAVKGDEPTVTRRGDLAACPTRRVCPSRASSRGNWRS